MSPDGGGRTAGAGLPQSGGLNDQRANGAWALFVQPRHGFVMIVTTFTAGVTIAEVVCSH